MEKYEDLPIGIDLGTSFSCIAVDRNSSVEIIPNEIGNRTTPSIVSFLDNEIFVGEQTEYLRLKEPKNKIYAVKRIIGRDFNDEEVQEDIKNFSYIVKNNNGRPKIEVNSNGIKQYSPEEISSKILEKLKQSAEIFLGKTISKVVITVPAYFTERQKQATKNAGEIAGLNVIKIINEPTAASLAYGFGKPQDNDLNKNFNFDDFVDIKEKVDKVDNFNKDNNDKNRMMDCRTNCSREINEIQKIIIFDLGGGTLDVTLLELEQDNIEIKAHSGKMHLGGEDFDNILLNYCIDKFKKKLELI